MSTLTGNKISLTYKSILKTSDNDVLTGTLKQLSDGLGNNSGVYLNTGGDLKSTGTLEFANFKATAHSVTINKLVNEADGISSNDNDTSLPTSAAVKDYVDTHVTSQDLDFSDGTNVGAVDLDSQILAIVGTTNEIETAASGQQLQIGLPNSITISGTYTGATFSGDLNGTINTATTAVTQSAGNNSTKVATTAYVDTLDAASDLDFSGTSGTGDVNLNTQTFAITGGANQITTAASNQGLVISLLSSGVTLPNNSIATTQSAGDNSTKIATTAYVDTLDAASDLDIAGDSGTGDVNLNTQTFTLSGTTNQITTAVSGQSATFSLPSTVHRNLQGNVTGNLTGNADTATKWATARDLSLTSEATGTISSVDGSGNVSGAVTLLNSAVTGKVLTGLPTPAAGNIQASDSILEAFGKLQSQVSSISNGLIFKGSWDADTNTPTLTSGGGEVDSGTTTGQATNKLIQTGQNFNTTVTVGDKVINQVDGTTALVTVIDSNTQLSLNADIMLSGEAYTIDASPFIQQGNYYVVNYAGTTNLNGNNSWSIGDWVIADADNRWSKLDHSQVDGQGTPGNLPVFATATTIGDSIVAQSGTALTVTGSLSTTLGASVTGDFAVNTNKFTVASSSGNTAFTGDLAINTNKFTVNATSGNISVAGTGTFAGNIEMKSDASNNTKFLRIWNEGTAANDDAVLTWQTQASRTYSMGIHRDSGKLVISSADSSVASSELITIDTSGNSTFAGTTSANIVIARDNMYVDGGQFYIGADNGSTDDTFRTAVASGAYKIESRESGTWTQRFIIDTNGAAAFSGDVEASGIYVGATNTSFDFYNQGTSYFNGTVTVDAAFTQSGGDASTFSGDVTLQGGRVIVKDSNNTNDAAKLTRDADEGYLQLFSSGSQTIELRGNGNSYFNGGNVGIGTTSPTSYYSGADNLVVYQASGEAGITVATATDTTGALYFADGTSGSEQYRGGIAYTHSTDTLSLVSGGANKVTIDSSGNATFAGLITCNNVGNDKKIAFRRTGANNFSIEQDSAFLYFYNETTSNVIFKMANNNDVTFTGDITITQNSGSLQFSNTGSGHGSITTGSSKDLNIGAASGNVYINNNTTFSGDVGIGGVLPSSNGGSGARVLGVHDGVGSGWAITKYTNTSTGTAAGDGTLFGIINLDAYIFNYETANIIFGTDSAERMRITSSGISEFKNDGTTASKQKSVLRLSGGGAANGYTLINDTYTATESQLNIGLGFSGSPVVISQNCKVSATVSNQYLSSNAQGNTRPQAFLLDAGDFVFKNTQTSATRAVDSVVALDERMRIADDGKVSIGERNVYASGLTIEKSGNHLFLRASTATAGKYWNFDVASSNRLYIINNGNTGVYINDGDTSFTGSSDEILKENIKPLNNVLDKIKDYRCVEYNLKSDDTKGKKIGFIAQDWQEDFAPIVDKDENEMLGMKYTETIPVLLKAIQELKAEVDKLKQECKCK